MGGDVQSRDSRPTARPSDRPAVAVPPARHRASVIRSFTLVEMLTVVSVIAILVGVIGFAFVRSGAETTGLQTAQTTLVGLLNLARSEAALRGQSAAVFINYTPTDRDRCYRYLTVAVQSGSEWKMVSAGTTLPPGCYVLPYNGPGSAAESGADWGALSSTALADNPVSPTDEAFQGGAWRKIVYSPVGTSGDSGKVVLCTGRPQPPGSSSPATFTNPDNVRGVQVSGYGQVTLLNSRQDF